MNKKEAELLAIVMQDIMDSTNTSSRDEETIAKAIAKALAIQEARIIRGVYNESSID